MKNENFYASRFGIRLKMRRIQKGLTQKELAEISGITQPMVARLEMGRVSNPHPSTLNPIYKALDLNEEQIALLNNDVAFEIRRYKDKTEIELGIPSWMKEDKEKALEMLNEYIEKINPEDMYLLAQTAEAIYLDENPKEYRDALKALVKMSKNGIPEE